MVMLAKDTNKHAKLFVAGVSHHRAPVEVREKLAGLTEAYFYNCTEGNPLFTEVLVLSTCNRLEVLVATTDIEAASLALTQHLATAAGTTVEAWQGYLHAYSGSDAARHFFRVASGLDSLVLGEPQILGQLKAAFRQALELGRIGTLINKLMHKSFRAAKRVRTETCLAEGAVSVAGAAISLAKQLGGGDLKGSKTLVLGAGPMAALALCNLKKRTNTQLFIANRTLAKAQFIACKQQAEAVPWEDLSQALSEADLIIAALGVPKPFLTAEILAPIMAERPLRPLTIIDIGVPRNAAHDVKLLPTIQLKNIDDLNEVVWAGRAARKEASSWAESIIDEELYKFALWLKEQDARPTVTALTQKAELIRQRELTRTLGQHDFTPAQTDALELMTSALVRRLLHDPLLFIKNASRQENMGKTEATTNPHNENFCPNAIGLDSLRQAFRLERN